MFRLFVYYLLVCYCHCISYLILIFLDMYLIKRGLVKNRVRFSCAYNLECIDSINVNLLQLYLCLRNIYFIRKFVHRLNK